MTHCLTDLTRSPWAGHIRMPLCVGSEILLAKPKENLFVVLQ